MLVEKYETGHEISIGFASVLLLYLYYFRYQTVHWTTGRKEIVVGQEEDVWKR